MCNNYSWGRRGYQLESDGEHGRNWKDECLGRAQIEETERKKFYYILIKLYKNENKLKPPKMKEKC